MRALWLVRENLTRHPGGDTTQIMQTAAALRARGVEVELCSAARPDARGCDVVHLFHLDRLWENEAYCRQIRAAARPAVLSPIYWPPDEFDRLGRAGLQGVLARLAGSRVYENARLVQRYLLHALQRRTLDAISPPMWSFRQAALFVLESVRVLLPNSAAEREQIERRFGACCRAVVVPNAADTETFAPPPGGAERARAGVLCVGRIEPRKNQLALLEALRGTDTELTFVGHSGHFSRPYYRLCRRAAGPRVRFLPHQPAATLRELYQAARVHACASWYETPGLASLEAALCGAALVVTPGGCTQEYFETEAHYCRPDDPGSIRAAVEAALAAGPPPSLAARVAREFTWQAAAEKTVQAYHLALEIKP